MAKRIAWCTLLPIWIGVCGLAAAASFLFDRTTSWKEEVLLSNGQATWISRSVDRGPDAFFRPGRGGFVRSSIYAELPEVGEVRFEWEGHEIAVAFDIVDGVPWVVMPIAGPDRCAKYQFPRESVAAFYRKGREWVWMPFERVPGVLTQNILRSTPIGSKAAVSVQDKTRRRGQPAFGLPLTAEFIPRHVRWEHSCPRISPLPNAQMDESSQEYLSLSPKALEVRVLSTHADTIAITRREEYRGKLAKERTDEEVLKVGCAGKIGRVESIRPWAAQRDGSRTSRTTAIRIDLPGATRGSIWLPISGESLVQIRCTPSGQYAVLINWSRAPHLTIAAFSPDGRWTERWKLTFPEAEFRDRGIIDLAETPRGFQITAGEINHNNNWHQGEPLATIGRRYVLEASKR